MGTSSAAANRHKRHKTQQSDADEHWPKDPFRVV